MRLGPGSAGAIPLVHYFAEWTFCELDNSEDRLYQGAE